MRERPRLGVMLLVWRLTSATTSSDEPDREALGDLDPGVPVLAERHLAESARGLERRSADEHRARVEHDVVDQERLEHPAARRPSQRVHDARRSHAPRRTRTRARPRAATSGWRSRCATPASPGVAARRRPRRGRRPAGPRWPRRPALRAWPAPPWAGGGSGRRARHSRAATAAVSSVDPSSTTTTSGWGSSGRGRCRSPR